MKPSSNCRSVRRRDFVQVGGLAALGLGMGDFLGLRRATAAEESQPSRATSCILIWLDGGPSHLETFDPKPEAPTEVRGPLETIATNVSGIRVSECFERTSQVMDKLAIVRSVTSPLGEHNFGTHYLLTGYKPSPALEYPALGATIAHLRNQEGVLPPFISAPGFSAAISGNGYLPSSTAPFTVGRDLRVRDLDFYQGLNLSRIDRRLRIVNAFDRFGEAGGLASTTDADMQRAYNLLASPHAKKAFDLSDEPTALRARYGFEGGSRIGQACLLARRLVERDVPFVTVNSAGWDTHQNITQLKQRYPTDRNAHLPALDRALSSLIEDLADRGLLDETLVVVMGEFGRTPKINSAGGRDHWPNVFSIAMAGGGVRGGQVLGASDALGELPKDDPVTPSDLAATVLTLLGVDPASELHTGDGRPVRVAADGAKVISQLMS